MSTRKVAHSLVAAALASLALASPSGAATDTTSITLGAGSLDFGTAFSAADFPATTLDGTVQTVKAGVGNWSVNDARGSLLGWNVKVQASQFSTGGGTPKTLPLGSLVLTAPTVSAGSGQGALLNPIVQTLTPIDAAAAVPLAVAAATKGAGLWNFSQGADNLTLTVLPTAEAGTYTSTITTTLSSGAL